VQTFATPGTGHRPFTYRTAALSARLSVVVGLLWGSGDPASADVPRTFLVTLSREVRVRPFTGRVYLFFSQKEQEPRLGPSWFQPEPFVALDVQDWPPEEPLSIALTDPRLLTFPNELDPGNLQARSVQAVARLNPLDRRVGMGVGNGFSDRVSLTSVPADAPLPLRITRLVEDRPLPETGRTKVLEVHSAVLSAFHGRDVSLRAAVQLPPSYGETATRRYPTIFSIPGFGGTHREGLRGREQDDIRPSGVEFLRVVLDPSCPLGHHVFADSANNGPVGTALVTEFLPALDREFRTLPRAEARFLTGHSSGGWSSLWLQVNYPDQFGGTWSTSPDPVDFRDFQRIHLYRDGENMYVDPAGQRRPLARRGGDVAVWYDDFAWMESVLGPGGQLHSFEAVFSPRGADGRPLPLWDRDTGRIDPAVARHWESYDLRLLLARNWSVLGPRLQGKLHVFMGEEDTFLLEGATRLLQAELRALGSDAVVEIHPGQDHGSLLTRELRARIAQEMADTFRARFPDWPNE
jgi:hypothetical protein